MTAEDKLKELYKIVTNISDNTLGQLPLWIDRSGAVHLCPQDIDLIADLVVERIKNDRTD